MSDEIPGLEDLKRTFAAAAGELGRVERILRVQHDALRRDPPVERVPDAARLAAAARLREGTPIVPRERVPVDAPRVAGLAMRLAEALGVARGFEGGGLESLVEDVIAAAAVGDVAAVSRRLADLPLQPDASLAVLREALKPEMLRFSRPLQAMVDEQPASDLPCPACGSRPAAGTREGHLLCRWCGALWAGRGLRCPGCPSGELSVADVRPLPGARLLQCTACGETWPVFRAPPEPLSLSLHGVLAAPFTLAARRRAGGDASPEVAIF